MTGQARALERAAHISRISHAPLVPILRTTCRYFKPETRLLTRKQSSTLYSAPSCSDTKRLHQPTKRPDFQDSKTHLDHDGWFRSITLAQSAKNGYTRESSPSRRLTVLFERFQFLGLREVEDDRLWPRRRVQRKREYLDVRTSGCAFTKGKLHRSGAGPQEYCLMGPRVANAPGVAAFAPSPSEAFQRASDSSSASSCGSRCPSSVSSG